MLSADSSRLHRNRSRDHPEAGCHWDWPAEEPELVVRFETRASPGWWPGKVSRNPT